MNHWSRIVPAMVLGAANFFVVPLAMVGETRTPPFVTVCDLMQDLAGYRNKIVIVVGRLTPTMEGYWLSQRCPQKLVTDGYEWQTSIWLAYFAWEVAPAPMPPKDFRWDKRALEQKLAEVRKTTELEVPSKYRPNTDEWGAVYGRLETRFPAEGMLPPGMRIPYGMGHPAGYGHLNGSPAQLVWPQPKGLYHFRQATARDRAELDSGLRRNPSKP